MIYTNFVDLRSLMLHAKFQNNRPSGSEEEDFLKNFAIYTCCSLGGHLGHVTTIYINFHFLFLRMLHIKFGFDWLIKQFLRKNLFEYYGHLHVYSSGAGADNPWA